MGIFGHSEETDGRFFPNNFKDVKEKYIYVLTNKMGCELDKEITDNEIKLITSSNFRYNMNSGKAIVSFLENSKGVDVKIRVIVNQTVFSHISAWIEKGFQLLKEELTSCELFEESKEEYILTGEKKINCPSCNYEFIIDKNLDSFF